MLNNLKKIYSSKNIILSLAFTDLKIRYVGSYLGIFWSLLEPLLLISVYSIIFPLILKTDFLEWFLPFICGLIPYRFFKRGVMEMTTCLVDFSSVLEKSLMNPENVIYAKAISTSLSFFIELFILLILVSIFVPLSPFILLLPIVFSINFLLNLGLGMYLSVFFPRMRDISYILTILFEALMFLTPIVYRIEYIPSLYRGIYLLNPIARLIYVYQAIFLHSSQKFAKYLSISHELMLLFLFSSAVFIIGYKKFESKREIGLELS
ncbi:MAG: ABC transporter permease [Candidatus Aenigmatarchaeota archaeon]